jgi:hypothetical protein
MIYKKQKRGILSMLVSEDDNERILATGSQDNTIAVRDHLKYRISNSKLKIGLDVKFL